MLVEKQPPDKDQARIFPGQAHHLLKVYSPSCELVTVVGFMRVTNYAQPGEETTSKDSAVCEKDVIWNV